MKQRRTTEDLSANPYVPAIGANDVGGGVRATPTPPPPSLYHASLLQ